MLRRRVVLLAGLSLLAGSAAHAQSADLDRDGLDDAFEQALIERFVPAFLVSTNDCDSLPSEFRPGAREPQALAQNGTLYAQAFRIKPGNSQLAHIEIHYYHLWNNDCGAAGHWLDVEHVSVLLRAPSLETPVSDWLALYWHAAAHKGTLCDFGQVAKAASLLAEQGGPTVWVSHGKHASYFSQKACQSGCGGDVCANVKRLHPPRIINIGEASAPMNGALWIHSASWRLAPKMVSDFTEPRLALLRDPSTRGVVFLSTSLLPLQSVIAAGGVTGQSLALSNQHTESALATAGAHTDQALATAANQTGKALSTSYTRVDQSLRNSHKAVKRFLGVHR